MKNVLLLAAMALLGCRLSDSWVPFDDEERGLSVPELGVLRDASVPFDEGVTDGAVANDGGTPIDAGGACPRFAAGTVAGRTALAAITEASGIAASRRNPGTLWTHNDSGAGPRVYALSNTGATQAIYDLGGASARDWEDLSVGPGPVAGKSYLYVGDIGDNAESRTSIDVYRVLEPDVSTGSASTPTTLSGVERFALSYPDRAHNAESLLIDPGSGDLYIVAKSGDGVSPVFRAAVPLSTTGTTRMELVTVLRFGVAPLAGNRATTGGDISPTGEEIAIRTYDAAFLWRRTPGSTIAAALATTPCPIPLQREPQGEAIGFASEGSGYYTVSEGSAQPIYFYARH